MRAIYRLLGVLVGIFLVLVVATTTFLFIKKSWFGGKSGSDTLVGGPHVEVVDIKGIMMTSTSTVKRLEKLAKDDEVKAILIRINSPGGLVSPSQEIFQAIVEADKKKPVVVSMGALAASGGYYAALGGRKIFANAGTMTASIGVIIEFANMEKLYQWAKMERFAITAGTFKSMGTPFRQMKPAERQLFQDMADDIHGQFKAAVKERRKLSDEEMAVTTDGRVMTGQQAKAAKLVDEIGSFEDAVKEAKKLAKLPDNADVKFHQPSDSLLRRLLLGDDEDLDIPGSSVVASWLKETRPGYRVMFLSPVLQ